MKPIIVKIRGERYDLILLLFEVAMVFATLYGYLKKNYIVIGLTVLIQFFLIIYLHKMRRREAIMIWEKDHGNE